MGVICQCLCAAPWCICGTAVKALFDMKSAGANVKMLPRTLAAACASLPVAVAHIDMQL